MALYKKTHGRRLEPTGWFVVYCNDLLVKKSFPSPEAAKEWAEYNYEHKNCWRVGPEMKRALIRTAERGDKQELPMTEYNWNAIDPTLLPCPFCGGKAYAAPSGSAGTVIRCGQCSARTVSDVGCGKAVEEWNIRKHCFTSLTETKQLLPKPLQP